MSEETPQEENVPEELAGSEFVPDAEIEESVERELSLSQKDYIPTPYKDMLWEGIETFDPDAQFQSMDVSIVESGARPADPMFERFDPNYETPTNHGGFVEEEEVESNEPVIDEAMLEEIRAEAFEAGKLEGRAEVEQTFKEQEVATNEQHKVQFQEVVQSISKAYEEKFQHLEKEALDIAIQISKRVLASTVDAKPDYILDVLRSALKKIAIEKSIVVRVNPNDYEFLEVEGLPEDLTPETTKVEFVVDENIKAGCVIETSHGELNLDLDSMWTEIVGKLFSVG